MLPRPQRAISAWAQDENADAVAAFAARSDAPEKLRVEALQELADWTKPPGRDRVTGLTQIRWHPRPPEIAADACSRRRWLASSASPDKVRQEAAKVGR